MNEREQFVERFSRAVLDLPQDAKVPCELLDAEGIPDEHRAMVAGALLSLLQAGDLIPDTWGPLGLVDDAITLRLAVQTALPADGEVRALLAHRFPVFFEELAGDLDDARAFLGDTFALFEDRLPRLRNLEHKGKRVETILRDEAVRAWLFDEVDEAMTNLEIAEDDLHVSMRRVDALVTYLRRRLAHR
jgi:uncharacterized membrane protein YkvA (DUF1232 family)